MRRDSRGSVLVEAAIAFPVLLFLILGAFDYGLLFRDDLTAANMTRQGARSGSIAGNAATADYTILKAVMSAAAALPSGTHAINQVIVFDASCGGQNPACDANSDPINTVPAACLSGPVDGLCNVYTPTDLSSLDVSNFGCLTTAAAEPDLHWCPFANPNNPNGRNVTLTNSDYLGLYISITHNWVTGYFGASRQIHDTVVFRLEPQTP